MLSHATGLQRSPPPLPRAWCRAESTWGNHDKGTPYITVYTGGKTDRRAQQTPCLQGLVWLHHPVLWRQVGKGKATRKRRHHNQHGPATQYIHLSEIKKKRIKQSSEILVFLPRGLLLYVFDASIWLQIWMGSHKLWWISGQIIIKYQCYSKFPT